MSMQNLDIFGGYRVIRNDIKQNPLCSERMAEWRMETREETR